MKHKLAGILAVVSLVTVLTGCGMSQEAKAVQEMIDQMPEAYSADIDADIQNARAALDALGEDDQNAVEAGHLEELEEAHEAYNQQLADEINEKIEAFTVRCGNLTQMNQTTNTMNAIMQEIENLPDSVNDLVHYDVLLEKIEPEFSSLSQTLINANDILVMEDVFESLNAINNAYSASTQYSYACDIESALSDLSYMFADDLATESLMEKVVELEDACLFGEDFEITLAALDVISEASALSDSITSFYEPFLTGDVEKFLDDCLAWEQTLQERMGK